MVSPDSNERGMDYDEATDALRIRTNIVAGSLNITAVTVQRTSGNVGIGTDAPAFTLEVNGSAGKPGGGSWSASCDERLEKNVHDLEGALETLLALRGVTFEYKEPEAIHELPGTRVGFLVKRTAPQGSAACHATPANSTRCAASCPTRTPASGKRGTPHRQPFRLFSRSVGVPAGEARIDGVRASFSLKTPLPRSPS